MKKHNKSNSQLYMESIRIPVPPPSVAHVDKKEKRKNKFDYRSELKNY